MRFRRKLGRKPDVALGLDRLDPDPRAPFSAKGPDASFRLAARSSRRGVFQRAVAFSLAAPRLATIAAQEGSS